MIKLNPAFPFFLFLLPLFFVLHGLGENYVPILIKEAFILAFLYSVAGILLTAAGWLFFRDTRKAALVSLYLLAFNFFFGSMHDFLKKQFSDSLIVKYSFLVPAAFLGLLVLIIYLKKTKKQLRHVAGFINLLLLVFVLIDLATLVPKMLKPGGPNAPDLSASLQACDTCQRPDIFLIVADEYAGQTELTQVFGFDNSAFENELRQRGFHIINNSRSNYNATIYSMSSMLSMEYLTNLESGIINHRDMLRCRGLIRENNLIRFLEKKDYHFFNHSYFELADKEKLVYNPFYPTKRALFTAQTFISRFRRNLGFHFASQQKIESIVKHHLFNNRTIDSATRRIALQQMQAPRFVYTHFGMPHHPYYFDSAGNETPMEKLGDDYKNDKKAYIEYLLYANKKLLSLIDHIKKTATRPPIIILVSDHGFRQLPVTAPKDYWFMNFNAVFLPGGNYTSFYDGMTNVNQFRVVLNAEFGQRLPLLKDSTVFFEEPLLPF